MPYVAIYVEKETKRNNKKKSGPTHTKMKSQRERQRGRTNNSERAKGQAIDREEGD